MLTQCPKCKAVFRITENQLNQASGKLRCGQCNTVFHCSGNKSAQLPGSGTAQQGLDRAKYITSQQNRDDASDVRVEDIPLPNLIAEQSPNAEQIKPVDDQPWQQLILGMPQPDLASDPTSHIPKQSRTIATIFIITTLILLLLGQFAYFNRNDLNRNIPLRGVFTDICEFIGCSIEPVRDLERIEIINRNVLAHPSIPKALLISATFANIAPFPQPYPILQISLTNLQGKVIATRRFSSLEYLVKAKNPSKLMPPGQPINASLEVLDPGNGAVAFEFQFY